MSGPLLSTAKQLIKRATIQTGLEAIALSGAPYIFPKQAGRGIIFTLHHVRPRRSLGFDPNALLSVTPEFLEQAIRTAIQCGLTPVHLNSLPELLSKPSEARRFICFTLDDGYRDNVEFAAPVFRRYQVPYTIFVAQGFISRTRTMWWETAEYLTRKVPSFRLILNSGAVTLKTETRRQKLAAFEQLTKLVQECDEDEVVASIDQAAQEHGIDPIAIVDSLAIDERELHALARDPLASIGAHTVSHVNLRRVSAERLRSELQESAKAIEDFTGQYPDTFAYPYGRSHAVGDREIDAVAESGFSVAVTNQPGMLNAQSIQRITSLNRVSLNGNYQKERYVKALISGVPFGLMRDSR
jgi:peptidoglycan/xylan/chitin deacetylase (PgdA/CDA1 family)